MALTLLHRQLQACRACEQQFAHEPRPMVWGRAAAPVVLIGQAPSRRVHETGRPFNDASGQRLRTWLGVSKDEFWNPDKFYITATAHCYPGSSGKAGGGDLPPPRLCSKLWLQPELELLQPKLYLLIGRYAAEFCYGRSARLSQLVFQEMEYRERPALVLPHPSPLNRRWFKNHPQFESTLIPRIQLSVRRVLAEAAASS